jgi:hypothetical protein
MQLRQLRRSGGAFAALFLLPAFGALAACGHNAYEGGGRRTDLGDAAFGVSATTSEGDAGETQETGDGGADSGAHCVTADGGLAPPGACL